MRLTKKLREMIQDSDASRYQISQQTGILQSALSRFMSGGNINLVTADKLAKFFDLELVERSKRKKATSRRRAKRSKKK